MLFNSIDYDSTAVITSTAGRQHVHSAVHYMTGVEVFGFLIILVLLVKNLTKLKVLQFEIDFNRFYFIQFH